MSRRWLVLLLVPLLFFAFLGLSPPRNLELGVTLKWSGLPNPQHELDLIAAKGYRWVRLDLTWDVDALASLLVHAKALGLKTIVIVHEGQVEQARSLASRYGAYVDVWQLLNEVDVMKPGWAATPYHTNEILAMLRELKSAVREARPNAKFLATFTMLCLSRQDLLQEAAKEVDFIGLDVYGYGQLRALPATYHTVKALTKKPIWITEFNTQDASQRPQYVLSLIHI